MFCNFFTFWLFFFSQHFSTFFFSRKSLQPLTRKQLCFAIFSDLSCLFFPTFFQLFFFPRKSLKSTHSLDFLGRKKKNSSGNKKNTIFTHSVDFCPKSANFKLFRGNKKIWYLWLSLWQTQVLIIRHYYGLSPP